MKCSKKMLASALLLLIAIKFFKRVASAPIKTKRSINANLEDDDNHSSLSRPKIPNYSGELDDYFFNDDNEDNYYDNIEHQPIPVWKINLNKTSADQFIFQSDMRLDPIQALIRAPLLQGRRVRRAAQSKEPNYLWRYNTIFYKIDKDFDSVTVNAIRTGIKAWKKALRGCLKFVRLDNLTREKRISREKFGGGNVHHVLFTNIDNTCWSNVGRTDTKFPDRKTVFGQQIINIGEGCGNKGTVMHEIGHAVGFWHEHSRKDRDNYIKIMVKNVLPGMDPQFNKVEVPAVESMGYAYDFGSIMHYGSKYFSKNGKPTIKIKQRYRNIYLEELGQRKKLSYIDVAQTRAMYKCNTLPSPESKKTCIKRRNKGQDYKGHLDYTRSGVMCQPWDKKYPHHHRYKQMKDDINEGKHNYCRNPGGEKERPWCFTTLEPGYPAWEYCDVKFCDEKMVIS